MALLTLPFHDRHARDPFGEVAPRASAAAARALGAVALLDVSAAGTITFITPKARTLLHKYFAPDEPSILPVRLREWLVAEAFSEAGVSSPLIAQREDCQLLVRVAGWQDRHFQLVLEERNDRAWILRLRTLGLTQREAEVLIWISRGKTRGEIAAILCCSARTVAKHTEHILAKLGAETRTAAAAVALEAAF